MAVFFVHRVLTQSTQRFVRMTVFFPRRKGRKINPFSLVLYAHKTHTHIAGDNASTYTTKSSKQKREISCFPYAFYNARLIVQHQECTQYNNRMSRVGNERTYNTLHGGEWVRGKVKRRRRGRGKKQTEIITMREGEREKGKMPSNKWIHFITTICTQKKFT